MDIKKHIPNVLTLFNLLSGCMGITLAFEGNLYFAATMIWIAAVFDFLDGFSARMLKVTSPLGKELDSLADMVTFGLLPAIIMFILIKDLTTNTVLPYLAFSVTIFSALRLANFNIDKRQSDQFIGLPTPASAFFISAIPYAMSNYFQSMNPLLLTWILILISFILSLLMVAEMPLFSLKFKNFKWENNKLRYIFVLLSVIGLVVFKIIAMPVIIGSYVILSFINLNTSK